MYTVKVVVDGPLGQKVSAQRKDKDRESGRIVGSVTLQTTLSVASGCVQGLHLAQVCPLVVPLCLNASIFTCNVLKHFSVFACLQCYSLYALELHCNRTSIILMDGTWSVIIMVVSHTTNQPVLCYPAALAGLPVIIPHYQYLSIARHSPSVSLQSS